MALDERDVSMDSEYRRELEKKLGSRTGIRLPQVFVKGQCLGGAEEIKQLHESGELGRILRGLPVSDPGSVCDGCGDARFVPCGHCNGSRKIFDGQLRRCPHCNENGLVRCPQCCN